MLTTQREGSQSQFGSLSAQCDYQCQGTTLSILMKPGYSTKGSSLNFLWSSGSIESKPIYRNSLRATTDLAEYNCPEGSSTSVIGFASHHPGTIMAHDMARMGPSGMYFFRDSFLCGSKDINVTASDFPINSDPLSLAALLSPTFLHHSLYFASSLSTSASGSGSGSGSGSTSASEYPLLVFLQAGDHILEKRLEAGESFVCSTSSLVAFEGTVSITLKGDVFSPPSWTSSVNLLVITGPGLILISGCNLLDSTRQKREGNRNKSSSWIVLLFRLVVAMSTITLMLSITFKLLSLGLEIRDIQELGAGA